MSNFFDFGWGDFYCYLSKYLRSRRASLLVVMTFLATVFINFLNIENIYASTASLSVSGDLNFGSVEPAASGSEYVKTIGVHGGANSMMGYKLYMSAGSDDTSLSGSNWNSFKIKSLEGKEQFLWYGPPVCTNCYGYAVDRPGGAQYSAIPKLSTPALLKKSGDKGEFDLKFSLGMRLDDKIVAPDSYKNTIVFSLLAKDDVVAKLDIGRNVNKAIKKALGVTDEEYLSHPEKTMVTSGRFSFNSFKIAKEKEGDIPEEKIFKVSTDDSPVPIYLGINTFDTNSRHNLLMWSDASIISFPEDMSYFFSGIKAFIGDFEYGDGMSRRNIDTKNIKNLSHFFHGADLYISDDTHDKLFENLIDDENVITNLDSMYENAEIKNAFYMPSKNLNHVKTARNMFKNSQFKTMYFTDLKISGIEDMTSMFENCPRLYHLDMSEMSTGTLTSIKDIFKDSDALSKLILPKVFNTSKITDMSYLFANKSSLAWLIGFKRIDTSSAVNMSHMFDNCSRNFVFETEGVFDNFNTSKVEDMSYMFANAGRYYYNEAPFPLKLITSSVKNMEGMFKGWQVKIDISGFNFGNVENMSKMFMDGCEDSCVGNELHVSVEQIKFPEAGIIAPKLTTIEKIFAYNKMMKDFTLPISAPKLLNANYAFAYLHDANKVDLSSMYVPNLENMEYMFTYVGSYRHLTEFKLFTHPLQNIKTLKRAFDHMDVRYCLDKILDLSNFNVSKVTDFSHLFDTFYADELDLTGWDTSKVEDMSYLFSHASPGKVYVSDSFVTSNVVNSELIFWVAGITGQQGSNAMNKDISYARIDGGAANPGAFWRK